LDTPATSQAREPLATNLTVPQRESLQRKIGFLALNIVQAGFFAFWTGFCVTCACVALPFHRKLPLVMARRMWSPPLLWAAGVRLQVQGLAHVPQDRPVIFVSNHQSMIDIALVFKVLPVNLHFVLKKELAYAPFIGIFAWATGMIFVDRKNSKAAIASVRKVGAMVRQGRSIMAFPEGTRCREPKILPFKKGIFVSALSAQVPVVPVAIEGAGRVLPSSGFAVRPSVVRISIGKPIFTEGMNERDRDLLIERAQSAVATMYEEIRLPPE